MSNNEKPVILSDIKLTTIFLKNDKPVNSEYQQCLTSDSFLKNKNQNDNVINEITNNDYFNKMSSDITLFDKSESLNIAPTNTNWTLAKNYHVKNWIKEFNEEISPTHNIYTYFTDPYKPYIVYLFVESNKQNMLSSINCIFPKYQITPFTCKINEENGKTEIKIKLYELSSNNNLIYNICFDIDGYKVIDSFFDSKLKFCSLFEVIFNLCYFDIIELICIAIKSGKFVDDEIDCLKTYNERQLNTFSVATKLKEFFIKSKLFLNGNKDENKANNKCSKNKFTDEDKLNICNENNLRVENIHDSDIKNSRFKNNFGDFQSLEDIYLNNFDLNKLDKTLIFENDIRLNEVFFDTRVNQENKSPTFNLNLKSSKSTSTIVENSQRTDKNAENSNPTTIDQINISDMNFRNSEIQKISTHEKDIILLYFLSDIKKLLVYLQSWTIRRSFFFNAKVSKKLLYVKKLSKKISYACRRYDIKSECFNEFILRHIKKIHDNLDKLTLFLIFTKLSKFYTRPKSKYYDLFVLSWIYLNYKPQNDNEKNELIQVVFLLNRIKCSSYKAFEKSKVTSSYLITVEQMNANIINRIMIIYFDEHRIFSHKYVPAWQFEILWSFMVHVIKLKCKLFNF